jgi:hypothetical protein
MPVQTHILPLWKIPLDGIIGGVSISTKPLDEGLGLCDIREADRVTRANHPHPSIVLKEASTEVRYNERTICVV